MHDELAEICDFLEHCPPFDGLDMASLAALTRRFVIRHLRRGATFPPDGNACLWLLRQGAIELRTADGQLARRIPEGDVHDAACLPDSLDRRSDTTPVLGRIVFGIADALAGRLLTLAETRRGRPPVPYAWIVFGAPCFQSVRFSGRSRE